LTIKVKPKLPMQEIYAVGIILLINSTAALVCDKQGEAMFNISLVTSYLKIF